VHTRAATGKLVWSWTVFSTSSVKGLVSIRFGTLTL
jgi:hypothetical protein